jgi:UDP-glucose:(heptosyl)LPS alpha-1,3-glucosyltransferase
MIDRVRFVGPSDDVAQYYAAADVFALPTEYEAWGLVIVEALASGLPVVTSRLAGAAVAIVDGRTGVLLDDPRNVESITAALGTILSGRCESAGRISESVEPYTWDHVLPRYEQILIECSTKH